MVKNAIISTKRKAIAAALALVMSAGVEMQPASASENPEPEPATTLWPAQIWVRVPFTPSAFPANGANHLLYELYATNFGDTTVAINRIDIFDPKQPESQPVASFTGRALNALAQTAGAEMNMSDDAAPVELEAGGTAVLFLSVTLPRGLKTPGRLMHRVSLADGVVEGVPIGAHDLKLKKLRSPVDGEGWLAADGPGNGRYNHHRRGIFVRDGALRNSRRFAVDWKQVRDDASYVGDKRSNSSYFAYGEPVFAVADAVVAEMRDGLPDNPPGHNADFHPAVPVTIDNANGNTVILDLGDGQFAHYYHLQPGSVRVQKGDRVRRGQQIAQIGASGDAREPHLHFEVTTSTRLLAGEGVPYLIDHYRVVGGEGATLGLREMELPLDDMLIDFEK